MAEQSATHVVLPLLPLRGMLVFPGAVVPLEVGRERSIKALEQALLLDRRIVLAAQKDAAVDEPEADEIYSQGVVAQVNQFLRTPNGQIKVLVEGVARVRIDGYVQTDPFYRVEVALLEEPEAKGDDVVALVRTVKRQFGEYEKQKKKAGSPDLAWMDALEPSRLADGVAGQLDVPLEKKQSLLEILNPVERLEALSVLLAEELHLLELEKRIQMRVRKQMERSQREYYFREQIKAIQKELGEGDERTARWRSFGAASKRQACPRTPRKKPCVSWGAWRRCRPWPPRPSSSATTWSG